MEVDQPQETHETHEDQQMQQDVEQPQETQQTQQQPNVESPVNENVNEHVNENVNAELQQQPQMIEQPQQEVQFEQVMESQQPIQSVPSEPYESSQQLQIEQQQQQQQQQSQIVLEAPNDSEQQHVEAMEVQSMEIAQAEQPQIEQQPQIEPPQIEQVQTGEEKEEKQENNTVQNESMEMEQNQESQQNEQEPPKEEEEEEEQQQQQASDQVQEVTNQEAMKEEEETGVDNNGGGDKMDVDKDIDEDIDILKRKNKSPLLLPELIECRHLLSEFMRRPETEPFNEPVDWKGLNLPDYPLIITKPMDLGTVLNKITNNKYSSADQFAYDIRLVFKNAKTYNTPGSGIYVVAENLHKQFERRFARITKNSITSKKRKTMDKIKNQQQSTFKDRIKFTNLIQELQPQELGQIVEIIDRKSPMALNDGGRTNNNKNDDDELEIEVYHIDATTLKQLITHCEKIIKNRNKRTRKK